MIDWLTFKIKILTTNHWWFNQMTISFKMKSLIVIIKSLLLILIIIIK